MTVNGGSITSTSSDLFFVTGAKAEITLANGATVHSGNGVILDTLASGDTTFTANAETLTGNMINSAGSTGSLYLLNHTALTGMIDPYNVTVDGTSTWNLTTSSTVNNLQVYNGAQINFLLPVSNTFKVLTVLGDLTGTGATFNMTTDLHDLTGDLIVVNGKSAGLYALSIADFSQGNANPTAALKVVQTTDGVATFTLKSGVVEAGVYDYRLTRGTGASNIPDPDDWYLVRADQPITETPASTNVGPASVPVSRINALSHTSNAIIGLYSAATMAWYDDLDTLIQRMGELRLADSFGPGETEVAPGVDVGQETSSSKESTADHISPVRPNNNGSWLRAIGQTDS